MLRKSFELGSFAERIGNMFGRLLFLTFVLFLTGCRNSVPDSGRRDLYTIATLKGPSSMGMIRLIDSLNNGEGHNVRVLILNEPLQVRKMMIDGSADFAVLPATMAAIVYNKGLEYRLVAVPVWGTIYLIGSDTTVSGWKDLKGKRVHVMARGMTPDVLFRYLLEENGLIPEKDVTLDYSFPTHIDLANAVASGQADIGVVSEPLASLVIKNNRAVRQIFSFEQEWKKFQDIPLAETAFMAKNDVIRNNRQLVEKIISAYEASTEWVNQYPDSAAGLIVKYNILPDTGVAVRSIKRSNLKFVRAGDVKPQVEAYLNIFYRMNPDITGGKIPDENFIYR